MCRRGAWRDGFYSIINWVEGVCCLPFRFLSNAHLDNLICRFYRYENDFGGIPKESMSADMLDCPFYYRNTYGLRMRRDRERKQSLILAMRAAYLDLLEGEPDAERGDIIEILSSAYRELFGEEPEPEMLDYLYDFSELVDEYLTANEE